MTIHRFPLSQHPWTHHLREARAARRSGDVGGARDCLVAAYAASLAVRAEPERMHAVRSVQEDIVRLAAEWGLAADIARLARTLLGR